VWPLARRISLGFLLSATALWGWGVSTTLRRYEAKTCHNIDVLSESINNPLRFCLGWYMVTASLLPPMSLLLSYWMLGAYFMTLKRFSEFRQIDNWQVASS